MIAQYVVQSCGRFFRLPEVRMMLGLIQSNAVALGFFFYLTEQEFSKFAASFLTSIILLLLLVSAIVTLVIGDENSPDDTVKGTMHGVLTAFLPVALIATIPAITRMAFAFFYLEFAGNTLIFLKGLAGLVWLLLALGTLIIGLAGIENDARKYSFPKARANWLLLVLGVVICGLIAQMAYHTWLVLWCLGYVASLVGGGFIVWNAKMTRTPRGENELSDTTFLSGIACWMLNAWCVAFVFGENYAPSAVPGFIFLVWPAAIVLVWLTRRYSGWKKLPAT